MEMEGEERRGGDRLRRYVRYLQLLLLAKNDWIELMDDNPYELETESQFFDDVYGKRMHDTVV